MSGGGLEEEDPQLNATLWVGNLDSKITESILYELFLQVRKEASDAILSNYTIHYSS